MSRRLSPTSRIQSNIGGDTVVRAKEVMVSISSTVYEQQVFSFRCGTCAAGLHGDKRAPTFYPLRVGAPS